MAKYSHWEPLRKAGLRQGGKSLSSFLQYYSVVGFSPITLVPLKGSCCEYSMHEKQFTKLSIQWMILLQAILDSSEEPETLFLIGSTESKASRGQALSVPKGIQISVFTFKKEEVNQGKALVSF